MILWNFPTKAYNFVLTDAVVWFIWARTCARRITPGLAGICRNSVSAFTVSPTLPGDVRPDESNKYAGGGGKLSEDVFIKFCCDKLGEVYFTKNSKYNIYVRQDKTKQTYG